MKHDSYHIVQSQLFDNSYLIQWFCRIFWWPLLVCSLVHHQIPYLSSHMMTFFFIRHLFCNEHGWRCFTVFLYECLMAFYHLSYRLNSSSFLIFFLKCRSCFYGWINSSVPWTMLSCHEPILSTSFYNSSRNDFCCWILHSAFFQMQYQMYFSRYQYPSSFDESFCCICHGLMSCWSTEFLSEQISSILLLFISSFSLRYPTLFHSIPVFL